jgi:hypothetical protein
MSEHKFIAGAIFFVFLELIFFGMMAQHNASINCPSLPNVNQANPVGWVISTIGLFFSPCSGLPAFVYILIFVPLGIVLMRWVVPW